MVERQAYADNRNGCLYYGHLKSINMFRSFSLPVFACDRAHRSIHLFLRNLIGQLLIDKPKRDSPACVTTSQRVLHHVSSSALQKVRMCLDIPHFLEQIVRHFNCIESKKTKSHWKLVFRILRANNSKLPNGCCSLSCCVIENNNKNA